MSGTHNVDYVMDHLTTKCSAIDEETIRERFEDFTGIYNAHIDLYLGKQDAMETLSDQARKRASEIQLKFSDVIEDALISRQKSKGIMRKVFDYFRPDDEEDRSITRIEWEESSKDYACELMAYVFSLWSLST